VQRPDILDRRRETVEHPFGTIKQWMNQGAFLMLGLEKVRAEFSLTATRLQSPARSQYRGVPRLDCRVPGLESMLEAVLLLKSATFETLHLATGLSQT
jgi:hypothetical protein